MGERCKTDIDPSLDLGIGEDNQASMCVTCVADGAAAFLQKKGRRLINFRLFCNYLMHGSTSD